MRTKKLFRVIWTPENTLIRGNFTTRRKADHWLFEHLSAHKALEGKHEYRIDEYYEQV